MQHSLAAQVADEVKGTSGVAESCLNELFTSESYKRWMGLKSIPFEVLKLTLQIKASLSGNNSVIIPNGHIKRWIIFFD